MSYIVHEGPSGTPNPNLYPNDPNNLRQMKRWNVEKARCGAHVETDNIYQNWLNGPYTNWNAAYMNYVPGTPETPPPVPVRSAAEISDNGLTYTLIPDPDGTPAGDVPEYSRPVAYPSKPGPR
jgi:hypothetical protein